MMARRRPWRPLAALAGAVIALHLAALDGLGHWRIRPGEPARNEAAPSFHARRIAVHRVDLLPRAALPPNAPQPAPPLSATPDSVASSVAPEPIAAATERPLAASGGVSGAPLTDQPDRPHGAPVGDSQRTVAVTAARAEAAAAAADATPAPAVVASSMRLHYVLTASLQGMAVTGAAELALRHDGANYEASLGWTGPASLTRTQRSAGAISAHGLAPTRHAERVRSEEAVHFDAASGRVVFSAARPPAALTPGAQDRLSVLWQLGALLAADPRLQREGVIIAMQVATTRDADIWRFVVRGPERLALPGGELSALRLVRESRGDFDPQMELWLAPGLDYALVRLRLTPPHGDWIEQQWLATDKR